MNWKLFIFGIFISIIFDGCYNSDYTEELSGEYFYRDEGGDTKDILSHLPNRKDIYSTVTNYDYNSDFIVAVQQPNYHEYKAMVAFNLRDNLKKYPTNSVSEGIESEKEADSILKNDPYYRSIFALKLNYWIIANKSNQVFGPLSKQEYVNKRVELHIPINVDVN